MTSRATAFVASTSWGARRARREEGAGRQPKLAPVPMVEPVFRFRVKGSHARDLAGGAAVLVLSALVWAYVAAAAFQPAPARAPAPPERPAAVAADGVP